MKFAPTIADPVRIMLLSLYRKCVRPGRHCRAIKVTEEAQTRRARSLEDICLLIGREAAAVPARPRGHGDRQPHSSVPIEHVARPLPNSTCSRAGVLATVLRGMGDYQQALALNQEAIGLDTAQHAPLALSVDRFCAAAF